MKRFLLAVLTGMMLLLAGCGGTAALSPQAQALQGKWAYIHDDQTTVLWLKENGTAVFHDKKYTYDCTDTTIVLTDGGKETALRYQWDGDDIYLYEQTIYTYDGTDTPDGLVGKWVSEENNWSFEFTKQGTFDEDGYFPGHYTVDEAEGTFKLMYNDPFEDTTCYYRIDGSNLLIEYPWHMVKAK